MSMNRYLLPILIVAAGCYWTPQVETTLHDTPRGIVALRTIADPTFRADHPAELAPALVQRILRGVSVQENPRLLQRLVLGSPKPKPLFSEDQIAFLAPLIADALTKATPEEEVLFQTRSLEEGSPLIEGTVLVHGTTVILKWKTPASSAGLSKKTRSLPAGADPSKVWPYAVMFTPAKAVHDGDIPQATDYLSEVGYNALAIDYEALALIPAIEESPSSDRSRATSVKSRRPHADTPSVQRAELADERAAPGGPGDTPDPDRRDATVEELKAQIDALKKELAEQRAVLEQLKRSTP